ncbi:arginine--tRNA ligase [Actinoalloteichus hoggarensis]|uniref:arginine--tRNA ligase n=1 Tax=Actinoalloteichus hoggarensis TaxID=1470176 RepID=UPI000B8A73D2|nr:arginine--tRNA ligase [Actinoalloteichus hoggarensis]
MLQGDVGLELGARIAAALRTALDVSITPEEALIRPSGRAGVDYQCNVAMSLAKRLGRQPREVAAAAVEHLAADDLVASTEIAGPGFVNIVLRDDWLGARLSALLADPRAGVPEVDAPRRFAIDYSSPNLAKEMHVGHLRSSIIGDALLRLIRFVGHEVVPHNHVGDWGTPFGMLIEHLLDEGWTADGSQTHAIADLNGFYQQARLKFDADADFADRARRRVVLLQGGDEATLALWQRFVDESTRHFEEVYRLLGISLRREDLYGESFYNPMLDDTVTELTAKGLTELSDGAVCVFPPGFTNREGERLPLIVRKSDGGYGYPATDLATARYWADDRAATDLLYVVGNPQAQHFAMVFAVCEQAGWLTEKHRAEHVGFGSILGADGKTIRTRAGGSVKLVELLNEAVDRASAVVAERTELDAEARASVAHAVGIGAVKYADLSSDREKDYVFSWDKMLAMDGNTAVYLQYANTRILSILRKAESRPEPGTPVNPADPAERALALALLRFPAAVAAAVDGLAPHRICGHLYELATAFSAFYERCPILAADTPEDVRGSRLVLAALTSQVLTLGLSLLGIEAPERL